MQARAHLFLLLLPLLVPGCSTQVEVSTETRNPSETTEHVQKSETKVGVAFLTDKEEPPDEKSVRPDDRSRTIEINGNHNSAVVVEGDLVSDPDHRPSPPPGKKFLNTKIPWPTQFRGASGWTLNCYLAVWALVIAAVALMIGNLQRKEGGPLWIVIAMLGAAAILLQFLPYTTSGVQLIPISPWAYLAWEAFFISLACWMAILGAGYVVIDRLNDAPQAFSLLVLVAMTLNVLLSWSVVK